MIDASTPGGGHGVGVPLVDVRRGATLTGSSRSAAVSVSALQSAQVHDAFRKHSSDMTARRTESTGGCTRHKWLPVARSFQEPAISADADPSKSGLALRRGEVAVRR
jgi:hypothetical protein